MFRNAMTTSSTVLTSNRPSDHASYAEVLVVKLPQAQQFVDDSFLLSSTSKFWYVARILDHAIYVEVCTESIADSEK